MFSAVIKGGNQRGADRGANILLYKLLPNRNYKLCSVSVILNIYILYFSHFTCTTANNHLSLNLSCFCGCDCLPVIKVMAPALTLTDLLLKMFLPSLFPPPVVHLMVNITITVTHSPALLIRLFNSFCCSQEQFFIPIWGQYLFSLFPVRVTHGPVLLKPSLLICLVNLGIQLNQHFFIFCVIFSPCVS